MTTAEAPRIVRPPAARYLALSALFGLAAVAYRALFSYDPSEGIRAQTRGAEDIFFEPSGGSPALIFVVAAWMVWRRRHRLAAALGDPPDRLAAALLLPAAAGTALWAYRVAAPDLLIVSLMALLPGVGALVAGRTGCRTLVWPALFLCFALPLPPVLLNSIIYPLQLWTAELSHGLLALLGIPAVLEADLIITRTRIFQVIETCSGLRLMETLTMAALVYAELLSRGRMHTVLLALAAPLLGIMVNAARVLTIILNPYSEFAAIHTTQGIVMLIVGVVVLAGFDRLLELVPGLAGHSPPPLVRKTPSDRGPRRSLPAPTLATLGLLLAALAAGSFLPTAWERPVAAVTVQRLPIELGGWKAQGLRVDDTFLGSVGFTDILFRSYRKDDAEVDLFLGAGARWNRSRSPVSDKTMLPGSGWQVRQREPDPDLPGATWLVVQSRHGTRLVLHWYEGVATVASEALRSFLALDRSSVSRPGEALVVRISTPLTPAGLSQAEARLRSFAPLVKEALASLDQEFASAAPGF